MSDNGNPPTNTIEPWDIITALYHMSDHLPVYMEIEVPTEAVGFGELKKNYDFFYDSEQQRIVFKSATDFDPLEGKFFVYSSNGKLVKTFKGSGEMSFDVSNLDAGLYIFANEDDTYRLKFSKNQ